MKIGGFVGRRTEKKHVTVIVGLMFIVVPLFIGFRLFSENLPRALMFMQVGQTAQGEVVSYAEKVARSTNRTRKGRRVDMYAPVVRFTTREGESVTFESRSSSTERPYRSGEKVEVIYNPAKPEVAEINSFMGRWFGLTMVSAMTLMGLTIGFFLLRYVYSGKAREARSNESAFATSRYGGAQTKTPADATSRAGTRAARVFVFLLVTVPLAGLFFLSLPSFSPIPLAAEGKVIAHIDSVDGKDARGRDLPEVSQVITFNTAEGRRTTFALKTASEHALPVGERVDLLYFADNPHGARIGTHPLAGWTWSQVFGMVVVLLLVPIAAFRPRRRK